MLWQVKARLASFQFNRSLINANFSRWNRAPLAKAGAVVRKIARGSIRRGPKGGKPSPLGSPPKSRQAGGNPPYKLIFSVPGGLGGTSQYVGMVGFNSQGTPGLEEHGGTATRFVKIYRRSEQRNKKFNVRERRKQRWELTQKLVRYGKRPFIFPALEKAIPLLPPLWANSIR